MKRLFYALIFAATIGTSVAQDVHFSQYTASPLILNPAMTGNINGMFRVAFNYRNQWFTIPSLNSTSPFQTIGASFDMALLRDRLENDGFGVGVSFYNDKAGDGALTTNSAHINIAYHKAVDRYGRARIGLGFQGGFFAKQIRMDQLFFESQYDGNKWNPSLYNLESSYSGKGIIQPDFNLGLLWQHAPRETWRYYVGFALNHIAKPKESFLGDERNRLDRRYVAHAGAEVFLNSDMTFSLSPTFLFMLQSNAQQYNMGLGLNYYLNDNIGVFGGVWYRVKDAVILNIGVEAYNARLGLSYDVNHSSLRTASRAQGALELSLVYIFKKEREGNIQYEKYCPNF